MGKEERYTVGMAVLGEDGLYRIVGTIREMSAESSSYATRVNNNKTKRSFKRQQEEAVKVVDQEGTLENESEIHNYSNDSGPEELVSISKEDAEQIKKKYKTKETNSGRELWHKRLAHVNHGAIQILIKNGESGMNLKDRPDTVECGPCVESKMVRGPHKGTITPQDAKLGDCVHTDILGPVHVKGYDRSRYILTL